jgi:Domain of unknown function (DUF4281)
MSNIETSMLKPEKIFTICNSIALIPWLLMIVAPNWSFTKTVIQSYSFPIALACVYGFYIAVSIGKTTGNFFSLVAVERLFRNRQVLLAAWVHYLVFDLFVGSWEWADSHAHHISHWTLVPCLLLTLMFGPLGFLVYVILRSLIYGVALV